MVEAIFVVFFTTVVMFAFVQICIMIVDDMTANEAAFVAMRSAAVTGKEDRLDANLLYADRLEEAKGRVEHYFNYYYYFFSTTSGLEERVIRMAPTFNGKSIRRSFHFADKSLVASHSSTDNSAGNSEGSGDGEATGAPVTLHPERPSEVTHTKDYSGKALSRMTVSIYYYTRVMFGAWVAKSNSNIGENSQWIDRNVFKIGGSRRYRSARSNMVPSPDPKYYGRAYPGAEKFKNHTAQIALFVAEAALAGG